jgi:hypothetical protein
MQTIDLSGNGGMGWAYGTFDRNTITHLEMEGGISDVVECSNELVHVFNIRVLDKN